MYPDGESRNTLNPGTLIVYTGGVLTSPGELLGSPSSRYCNLGPRVSTWHARVYHSDDCGPRDPGH
jgi:hypothetical protein